MGERKKIGKLLLNILIPLMGMALFCILLIPTLKFFLPFVLGWVIAMIANPLVRFFEKKLKIVRKHGSAIVVILVLSIVIGGGYGLIYWLVSEIIALIHDIPEIYELMASEIKEAFQRLNQLFSMLPRSLQLPLNVLQENIGESISTIFQNIAFPTVEVAGNVAKSIPNILVGIIVTVMSSYFFIVERDKVMLYYHKYVPNIGSKYYKYLQGDAKTLVSGYFLAQFRIMFVVAAILVLGFWILDVPYWFLIGILVAMLDFLPLFGTGTVLIPWAIVKLLSGDYFTAIGMVLLYVLTQVVRQIIQPKIVGDSMGLPPLLTLLLLFLGFKFAGISGMIFAVPIGIVVMKLFKYGAFDVILGNSKALLQEINKFRKE